MITGDDFIMETKNAISKCEAGCDIVSYSASAAMSVLLKNWADVVKDGGSHEQLINDISDVVYRLSCIENVLARALYESHAKSVCLVKN